MSRAAEAGAAVAAEIDSWDRTVGCPPAYSESTYRDIFESYLEDARRGRTHAPIQAAVCALWWAASLLEKAKAEGAP